MSVNQLIFRNLKKNLRNYYLYVFALIFSVGLYFAFVTLQYDPSMDPAEGTIKGAAGIKTASILLVVIVSVFLLYANNIFIKRRSKEIGLLQLIGMTKGRIFRILSAENFILYFGSMVIGILVGFSFSKLIIMILFKSTGVDAIATLRFSTQALLQTVVVFSILYVCLMLMNFLFIKKQTILSLFRVLSSTEEQIKKVSVLEVIIGLIGIGLISSGYFISTKLFDGDFVTTNALFFAMIYILGSVIVGTYLFYKGSVRFIFHLIRKQKNGYLNINEVLSLSSIMFRMKSNSFLLTIITTVSALAIGLLSLSYISYYSAEKTAENRVPADFSITDAELADTYKSLLDENDIAYQEEVIEVVQVLIDVESIMETNLEELNIDMMAFSLPTVSDTSVGIRDLKPNETLFTGYNDLMQKFMTLKDSGNIELKGKTKTIPQKYVGLEREYPISWYFTDGGLPVAIVDETVFQQLKEDKNPEIQPESSFYIGIDIKDKDKLEKANTLFTEAGLAGQYNHDSRLDMSNDTKKSMGLAMFIVGFLGLTFLITSGCILYFKQMDESEEEKPNYTILRKLGFTQTDLLRGIKAKQLFNFGIPLLIGLLHSYFAVQSGWFMFGEEVWTPMIIVMVIYTGLYSIFGLLSVMYYKKIIKDAL
ncbi:ABC transporter permease [Bacillus tianshenii]|uniref:ABC transporter permease n=1 Tax=Sutcliffiella tianshenii TaxID=1463404 RepID=UPI001CD418FB|nr:ABC transporter permease [Bacillus tianshenii]MCA1321546.1 ABC transporter permease [Bacillus tianshenii]